jgi:cell division protease FtsH
VNRPPESYQTASEEGDSASRSARTGDASRPSSQNHRQPRVVGEGQDGQGPEGPQKKSPLWTTVAWVLVWGVVMAFVIALVSSSTNAAKPKTLSYSTFLADAGANKVKSVQISESSGVIDGALADGKQFTAQGPTGGLPGTDLALLARHHVARNYAAPSSNAWSSVLLWVLPVGLLVLVWLWLSRRARGQMSGFSGWSRSQAKVHVTEHPSTSFDDIAGYEGVKQEVGEVVSFLKEPDRFKEIGARIPEGILLVGPPGTGKTLFARAIAGEAKVAFITISGSQFMEMFVGVGAARVRDLFKTAREHKPSIVFVDEIDAIGRKRGTGLGGTHDEREQTLNQLLAEMDGFEPDEGVVVLAATNRPDVLDPALLRAGRFDRQIVVPLPTLDERRAILSVHARGKRVDGAVDLDALARSTPGMSGADLENMLNEAALIAVRRGNATIEQPGAQLRRAPYRLVPRGGTRRAGGGARACRPGAQGDDLADRHGTREYPTGSGGGTAALPAP